MSGDYLNCENTNENTDLKNIDETELLKRYYEKCDAVIYGTTGVREYGLSYLSSGTLKKELEESLARVEAAFLGLKELHAEILRRTPPTIEDLMRRSKSDV